MTEEQKPPPEPDRAVPPFEPDYDLITYRQKAQPDLEETFKRLAEKRREAKPDA